MYIPKTDRRLRPLGIASLEYEVDFLGFSYGFRRERSQHDAPDALVTGILRKKVSWVLNADIRGFFDAIDHGWMAKFVEHRIAAKRVLRLIQKWLTAGVMEDGTWTKGEEGTPQGATVSPLLANVYRHYVLDLWAQRWRRRRARRDIDVIAKFVASRVWNLLPRDRFVSESPVGRAQYEIGGRLSRAEWGLTWSAGNPTTTVVLGPQEVKALRAAELPLVLSGHRGRPRSVSTD